jgi:hypothetical protein
MYSREFAQGASNCCPNGCCEGRVKRATIDELREMEKEALERVHAANLLLGKAQHRAIEVRKGLIGSGRRRSGAKKEDGAYSSGTCIEETKVAEHLNSGQITHEDGQPRRPVRSFRFNSWTLAKTSSCETRESPK